MTPPPLLLIEIPRAQRTSQSEVMVFTFLVVGTYYEDNQIALTRVLISPVR
jgi:hypothetical protein